MDNPVVLDYGSKTFKAGLANSFPGEEEPRVVTPAAVQVDGVASKSSDKHVDRQSHDTLVRFPVQHGKIEDFDQFEALLYYILYDLLGWEFGEEGSVVIVEPLFTAKPDRELLTQLLFEVFNVSGLFLQDSAVLSLYAVGKLSGCSVDIGGGKVDIATVTEGVTYAAGARRLAFAGSELSVHMQKLLAAKGVALEDLHSIEALKEMCCKACESMLDFDCMVAKNDTANESYQLPDGQDVTVSTEGYEIAEALFRPSLMGMVAPGLADAAVECMLSHGDINLRKQVFENILVCGGGSSIPGVAARLVKETKLQVPPSLTPILCSIPEYMPSSTSRYAPWIGGAVLAKVLAQQSHFMTKGDYEETGPAGVHRKCS